MATDHNFKVKNGLTVQGSTLVVNSTENLSGTQVYIKKLDANTNLQRWGEGTSGQSTYRFRIDQDFKFIANSGSTDVFTLFSNTGNITTAGSITFNNNSVGVITRQILARDTNGLSLKTTGGTEALSINNSANATFAGTISSGAITARADTDALFVKSVTNQNAAEIAFSSQGPSTYAQIGRVSYQHGDTLAYGGTDVFTLGSTESSLRILADGLLMFKDGIAIKPSSGTGAGTTIVDSSRNLTNIGTISSGAITASGNSTITGSGSSGNAFTVVRGNNGTTQALRVQNAGEVVVGGNYLYAAHTGTAFYSQGQAVFRNGILNDGGDLEVRDNLNITTSGVLKMSGTTVLDTSRNLSNINNITSTSSSGSASIHITSTRPTLGFTDTNSFSDANDIYLVRGTGGNKLQFQYYDDSAGSTTETFNIDSAGFGTFASDIRADGGDYYGDADGGVRYRGYGDTSILTGVNGATYLYAGGSTTVCLTLQSNRTIAPQLAIGQVNNFTTIIDSSRNMSNIGTISSGGHTLTSGNLQIDDDEGRIRFASSLNWDIQPETSDASLRIKTSSSANRVVFLQNTGSGNLNLNVDGLITSSSSNVNGALTVTSGDTSTFAGTDYLNINANVGGVNTNGSHGLHIGWNKSNGGREINMIFDGGTTQADTEMIFTSTDGTNYSDIFQINGAGNVDIKNGGLRIGTTTVIDSSRNLTNISAITATGNVTIGSSSASPTLTLNKSVTGESAIDFDNGGSIKAKIALDSAETLQFKTGSSSALRMQITEAGVISFGNNAYSFPTSDGSNGQVLQTDGSGNLSFGTVSSGSTNASTLDSLDSTQFLRSDANDSYAGILNINGMEFRNDSNTARNLRIQANSGAGGSDVGISGFRADGTHGFQIYGDGTNYGFLDANWANWDLKKTKNGQLQIDEGSGLNKVWSAGNDGAGSGLDADNLDGSTWSTYKSTGASYLNIEAGDGKGIRFWNGSSSYNIYMSQDGASGAGRVFGDTTSDYNMYFRMTAGTNRGFAFQSGTSTPHTGIDSTGNLRAGGVISSNNKQAINCAHWGQSGTSTGAIKITLPGAPGSVYSMPIIEVATYDYSSKAHVIYRISGHNWSTASNWYNNRVTAEGGPPLTVRLGRDGTNNYVIIIGDTNTSWSYGHATVSLLAHPSFYNTAQNFTSGWGISQVTSLPTEVTVASVGKLWHSLNDGSGSGLDADTLDGVQASSFLRSDATDSASGTLNLNGRVNIGDNLTRPAALNSDSVAHVKIGASDVHLYVASLNSTGGYKVAVQAARDSDFAAFTLNLQSNGGALQRGGNTVWDAGNDGSGSGLDADTLDGVQLSSIARTDTAETFTNNVAVEGNLYIGPGSNDGYFYSDTNGRTAFANGDFYIQNSVGNYYNYATNQYIGDSSGDNIYFRGNVLSGTGWSINGAGKFSTRDIQPEAGYVLMRSSHQSGHLEGSYNNIGGNSAKTNPIYTIGSAYNPGESSLSNMYGIGYAHPNLWGTGSGKDLDWGLYAVANGSINFIAAAQGTWSSGEYSRNGNKVWDAGNDGAGSGLDADLFEGQQGSYYHSQGSTGLAGVNRISSLSNFNNSVPSGFYQSSSASNMPGSSWHNMLNVRHSNTANDHGFQLSMSYYNNDLYSRSYQGGTGANNGTFQSWAKQWSVLNDGAGSGLDADLLDGQQGSYYYPVSGGAFTGATTHPVVLFSGVGGNSGNGLSSYGLYQQAGAWSNPFPDLILGYHTGVKIGGYFGYNGTRFYNDHPDRSNASEIFSIGNTDNHTRLAGNCKLYFNGNTSYGIGAGGHNFNSGYFDTLESGASGDPLELVYYQGNRVNIGSGGGTKPLGCSQVIFGNTTSRSISHGVGNGSNNAVKITGNWDQFEVMGRVLDVTGSNCHFMDGYGSVNHASHYFQIGTGGGGNGGLGSFKVGCVAHFTNDVIAYYSDARLKQNVKEIPNALGIIKNIRGVTYEWNKLSESVWSKKEGDEDFGLISQEVEAVFPMGVAIQNGTDKNRELGYADPESENYDPLHDGTKDEVDYKTVKYDKMVSVAIQAIKEQQEIIETLQEEIKELKKCITK